MFTIKRKQRKHHVKNEILDISTQSWEYMYRTPPSGEITLEQFEIYSYERYTLLRNIEIWKMRGIGKKKMFENIKNLIDRKFGDNSVLSEKDQISHNVLRLAYCKTENLRTWFITQEMILFEYRLSIKSGSDLLRIARKNNFLEIEKCSGLSETEKDQLQALYGVNKWSVTDEMFKVDFVTVLDLVRQRKVLLKKGKAYVTGKQLVTFLMQAYEKYLKGQLFELNKKYNDFVLMEKDRLVPFLNKLVSRNLDNIDGGSGQFKTNEKISLDMLNQLQRESFPACMKVMYEKVCKKHHLKHMGRMQFGLFLKGIGLNLNDSIRFWKSNFTKRITEADFTKNYLYNIKHNYGVIGKRQNYSPYGCQKIITQVGEDCGCPFRNFNQHNLRNLIKVHDTENKIQEMDVKSMLLMAKRKQYQLACRTYFELIHPSDWPKEVIEKDTGIPFFHPNKYFKISRKIIEAQFEDKSDVKIDEKVETDGDVMDTSEF